MLFLFAPTSFANDLTDVIKALHNRASTPPALRLQSGLIPPTNKWFSSLVFAPRSWPVYAHPLSMRPAGNAIELDYPLVTAGENSIFAPHRPTIRIGFQYDEYKVSAYDHLSVELAFVQNGTEILHLKVTQGSPFAFITANSNLALTIAYDGEAKAVDAGYSVISAGGRKFGVVVPADRLHSGTAMLDAGESMAVFAIDGSLSDQEFRRYAEDPILRTRVDYQLSGQLVKTTYHIETVSGGPQLFAAAPHADITGIVASGHYESLLGQHPVYSGTEFSSTSRLEPLPLHLDLTGLRPAERDQIVAELKKEAAELKLGKPDSYFGGKELYRAANLLDIAAQLGLEAEKEYIRQTLASALSVWFLPRDRHTGNNRYFYYDTTLKGLVGAQPMFGSEIFNDHHFHYGYFIYASAVLARYDREFLKTNRPMIDALISTIASPREDGLYPRLRVFDFYSGHSWASGYADFPDGNNQESSSEAVHAWYAAYLWGKETGNAELQQLSRWLYREETEAARTYWLRLNNPLPAGYRHSFVALLWGGKLDFGTFFSAEPQAKLGIQLIPFSPGAVYLEPTAGISDQILASALPPGPGVYGKFADYLIMYQAMFDKDKALLQYGSLNDVDVDSANSRSYMLAWILTRKN